MVTAVDTSVLLDVLLNDIKFAPGSIAALRQASIEGSLVLGETVLAELIPVLTPPDVSRFLSEWSIAFVASTQPSSILAGEMFRAHLARGGKRGRVVGDFLIAAHAQTHADRLLARDRGFYRDYFKDLRIWDPSPTS
jgi:predicted nucleic acid-binding protein